MQPGNCRTADAVGVQTGAAIRTSSTEASGHGTMHLQIPGTTTL